LTTAVPLVSSWSLVAGVVSLVFLREVFGRQNVVGAFAVFAGVVLISLDRQGTGATSQGSPRVGRRRAFAAALASALGFGVMVPAMGHVAPATGVFGATAIVFILGIGLAVTGGGLAGMRFGLPPRAALSLVLATGLAETMGFVSIAAARPFAPMTVVAPIATLSSAMTVIYAWAVLRERPRRRTIAGALLACAGVVLLAT
jgi:drug/metabolite transporter (DMT)-like permease